MKFWKKDPPDYCIACEDYTAVAFAGLPIGLNRRFVFSRVLGNNTDNFIVKN